MAIKKIYFGSVGPFEYDDTDPIDDVDGDFAGENYRAVVTNDQLLVERAPAVDDEVLRLIDLGYRVLPPVSVANINNPTELNSVAGVLGTMVLAYEIVGAGGQNEYTIYVYDASGPAVNSPYVVDADGAGAERWIALAGKYFAQNLNISGSILLTGTVDGVDIAVHAANVNAHHNQIHLISSHSDTNLAGIANNDLWQWNDPASVWIPKSIQEIILSQNINPGNITMNDGAWIGIGALLERIIFDAAGDISFMGCNVGIRTMGPSTPLEVVGAITATHIGSSQILQDNEIQIIRTDGGGSLRFISRIASISSGSVLGRLLFVGNENGAGDVIAAAIYGEADGDWTGNTDTPSRVTLHTVDDGTAVLKERVRVDRRGNVGIDNINPTLPLDVKAKAGMTAIGGFAIKLTNKTGANSVAGQVVKADTANNDAVILTGVSEQESIAVFLESGVADGSEAWVVISGIADVAMEDNTAATRGNWVYASAEAGYANATLAAPPLGGVAQLDQHMQEIGHCIESVAAGGAGTHILARCVLHFN